MTMANAVTTLKRLPPAERILAVEQLWDSLADDGKDIPLSAAQGAELDRRLAAYRKNPKAGSSWAKVKSRILRKSR